jgi:hypothetical protein
MGRHQYLALKRSQLQAKEKSTFQKGHAQC